MPLKVELSKFKVKQGKSKVVDGWMKLLNDHMENVLFTLKDEKMYIETIFREKNGENEYLYWYSVQGEGGINVENSQHEVDKVHLKYWYECIDEEVPHVDMTKEVVMIQEPIRKLMT